VNWFILILNKLNSILFTDVNTGYCVGDTGVILRTSNQGMNWTTINSGTDAALQSVFFANANVGYISGERGIVLKTTNGGVNWLSEISPTLNTLDQCSS
jgi:photosystem II stability/assembly factor-like uncharacterized protein